MATATSRPLFSTLPELIMPRLRARCICIPPSDTPPSVQESQRSCPRHLGSPASQEAIRAGCRCHRGGFCAQHLPGDGYYPAWVPRCRNSDYYVSVTRSDVWLAWMPDWHRAAWPQLDWQGLAPLLGWHRVYGGARWVGHQIPESVANEDNEDVNMADDEEDDDDDNMESEVSRFNNDGADGQETLRSVGFLSMEAEAGTRAYQVWLMGCAEQDDDSITLAMSALRME